MPDDPEVEVWFVLQKKSPKGFWFNRQPKQAAYLHEDDARTVLRHIRIQHQSKRGADPSEWRLIKETTTRVEEVIG